MLSRGILLKKENTEKVSESSDKRAQSCREICPQDLYFHVLKDFIPKTDLSEKSVFKKETLLKTVKKTCKMC